MIIVVLKNRDNIVLPVYRPSLHAAKAVSRMLTCCASLVAGTLASVVWSPDPSNDRDVTPIIA